MNKYFVSYVTTRYAQPMFGNVIILEQALDPNDELSIPEKIAKFFKQEDNKYKNFYCATILYYTQI